jgi:hypothetical protein
MPVRANGSHVGFLEKYCHIHGKFGDKVYRRKRNGKPWVYDYHYIPKYHATTLSKRTSYVLKAAAGLSNPQYKGYNVILNKLYYYTPYFVYAGRYSFTCNTFLKLRQARTFTIDINGIKLDLKLAPRSKLPLHFAAGNYTIKCYIGSRLYSERQVIVIDETADLKTVYSDWYDEHLSEILQYPDPRYRAMWIYRRGIEPPAWINSFWGKTKAGIVYRSSKRDRFMYVRSSYEHVHRADTDYFYTVQKRVNACWNATAGEFKEVLKKYCWRWFDGNYKRTEKIVKVHNLWSKLVFMAGGILGFDLEELSPDNWLPGVETMGDLLEVCGMGRYGLSGEELSVRILNFEF